MNLKQMIGSAVALLALAAQAIHAAEELPKVNTWIPGSAVVVLEITEPKAFLEPLLSPEMSNLVTRLPAYREAGPKLFGLLIGLTMLENQLGTDWRTALRKVFGGGITFASGPKGETLLAIDATDEKLLRKLHQTLFDFVSKDAAKKNKADSIVTKDYRGVGTWSFSPNEIHTMFRNRLLLANKSDFLNAALDLRADPKGKSILGVPLYAEAKRAVEKDSVATLYFNLQALKENPKLRQALSTRPNLWQALFLGDSREALQKAKWAAFGFYVKGDQLSVRLVTDGKASESGPGIFSTPSRPEEGLLPNLPVPGNIGAFSFYRDLPALYAVKDTLFPGQTDGLTALENNLGNIFNGMSLTELMTNEIKPEIRLVTSTQRYDPAFGPPETQLPAFAAILRAKHPEKFGNTVEDMWQKAVEMFNLSQTQQGLPGLVIDHSSEANAKISLAYYRPPSADEKKPLPSRYNYRPTLARVDDYLILSSTDQLAKDLVQTMKNGGTAASKAIPSKHSLLEMDGGNLLAILQANRELLVRNNMRDKHHTRQQAESEITTLLTLLEYVNQANLSLGHQEKLPQATLEIKFKAPPAAKPEAAGQ